MAEDIFNDSMAWLKEKYESHRFFKERDLVWVIQLQLWKAIEKHQLSYHVFNDFAIKADNKKYWVDLAIVEKDVVRLALEFKYEPFHGRKDLCASKFPVINWSQVVGDTTRISHFVECKAIDAGYSVFFDEGCNFRCKPVPNAVWENWSFPQNVSILTSYRGGPRE